MRISGTGPPGRRGKRCRRRCQGEMRQPRRFSLATRPAIKIPGANPSAHHRRTPGLGFFCALSSRPCLLRSLCLRSEVLLNAFDRTLQQSYNARVRIIQTARQLERQGAMKPTLMLGILTGIAASVHAQTPGTEMKQKGMSGNPFSKDGTPTRRVPFTTVNTGFSPLCPTSMARRPLSTKTR